MPTSEFCRFGALQRKNKRKQKIDKYLNLARELKMLWNKRETVIAIVVGVRKTSPKRLKKKEKEKKRERKKK